jgi:aspartate aminotransferase
MTVIDKMTPVRVSEMAENLIGSEIIRQANEINEKIRRGEKIYNLTIGDFNPSIFPIPEVLQSEILNAYREGHTNYPMANGMPELREAVSEFVRDYQELNYSADEILISGGSRPLIYAVYQTLTDPGDKVIFPVPSWNNNHYCHLTRATPVMVEAYPENNFMPTADSLRDHVRDARMIALCSPLNPTGTVFGKEDLESICDLVIEENRRRADTGDKPLYILYDQVYSVLVHGATKHHDPVTLRPELRDYTVCIDGTSKAFSATGVRVGWAFGPSVVIQKMRAILSHIGAWSPKAEQIATSRFLRNKPAVSAFLGKFKQRLSDRLNAFYEGLNELKEMGHKVDVIEPQASIYLTIKFDLIGMRHNGNELTTPQDVTNFLCDEAKLAIVPFSSFGSERSSNWYRLSVGVSKMEDIPQIISNLKEALGRLDT